MQLRLLVCNDVSWKYIGPLLREIQPKYNVVEVIKGLLMQYLWYFLHFYIILITLTVLGTSICVDETAVIFYEKKITMLNFHSLGGFYFTCSHKPQLVGVCGNLCFTTLSLLLCLVNSNASVRLNSSEVVGDTGETNRVSQRATSRSTKWHNTNLSVDIITLLVNKWTTTVTL
jgi:hypothetical protein